MAGRAPSVHNTQPWRWTVLPDRLELTLDTHRQLAAVDPQGRLAIVSCGAALHHARVALAAEGWEAVIHRLPDPARPDLLAVVLPGEARTPDPAAMRLVQSMWVRHTDRRPLGAEPLSAAAVSVLAEAARAEGVHLHVLDPGQVYDLAAAANRAAAVEAADERAQAELAYWTSRGDGLGVPASAVPAVPPATTVPARDFGRPGTLPVGEGHDRAAVYGVLYGPGDDRADWLRAGEALSAAWLTATVNGVALLPLSAVIEVDVTRSALRRLISGFGWPYLVLRLGIADPEHAGPAVTPRLAPRATVDTSRAQ
ncbi:Acg family FMN-binding oxidoreductase [Spirilliplanes yamanashiensis]|nr:nitroreductase [Spirilliplanes yamanashiensis]